MGTLVGLIKSSLSQEKEDFDVKLHSKRVLIVAISKCEKLLYSFYKRFSIEFSQKVCLCPKGSFSKIRLQILTLCVSILYRSVTPQGSQMTKNTSKLQTSVRD